MRNDKLRLVPLTHPAVRGMAKPIGEITPKIERLAEAMLNLMRQKEGVGLAAPQVGQSIQLIIAEYTPPRGAKRKQGIKALEAVPTTILINPKLRATAGGEIENEEGCLTTPGIYGLTKRAAEVTVEGLNLKGKKIILQARGFLAQILQHELDHLKGVLFLDRVGDPKKLYSYTQKSKG